MNRHYGFGLRRDVDAHARFSCLPAYRARRPPKGERPRVSGRPRRPGRTDPYLDARAGRVPRQPPDARAAGRARGGGARAFVVAPCDVARVAHRQALDAAGGRGRHVARGGNARQDDAAVTRRDDAAVTRRDDAASKPAVYPWAVQLALSMQRGNQTRPGFHPYSHFGVYSHLRGRARGSPEYPCSTF